MMAATGTRINLGGDEEEARRDEHDDVLLPTLPAEVEPPPPPSLGGPPTTMTTTTTTMAALRTTGLAGASAETPLALVGGLAPDDASVSPYASVFVVETDQRTAQLFQSSVSFELRAIADLGIRDANSSVQECAKPGMTGLVLYERTGNNLLGVWESDGAFVREKATSHIRFRLTLRAPKITPPEAIRVRLQQQHELPLRLDKNDSRRVMEPLFRAAWMETLTSLFVHNLEEAAQRLRMSVTSLKRVCRENGIPRWPSRTIKKQQRAQQQQPQPQHHHHHNPHHNQQQHQHQQQRDPLSTTLALNWTKTRARTLTSRARRSASSIMKAFFVCTTALTDNEEEGALQARAHRTQNDEASGGDGNVGGTSSGKPKGATVHNNAFLANMESSEQHGQLVHVPNDMAAAAAFVAPTTTTTTTPPMAARAFYGDMTAGADTVTETPNPQKASAALNMFKSKEAVDGTTPAATVTESPLRRRAALQLLAISGSPVVPPVSPLGVETSSPLLPPHKRRRARQLGVYDDTNDDGIDTDTVANES